MLSNISFTKTVRQTANMMTCRVAGCRFPTTHVTMGHRCGTCGQFGHGQLECGSQSSIDSLKVRFDTDRVNTPCTVESCRHKEFHITAAHHCGICNRFGGTCDHTRTRRTTYIVSRACPACRVPGPVDLEYSVFSSGDCVICLDSKPCVVMQNCRHANVCKDCMQRLGDD